MSLSSAADPSGPTSPLPPSPIRSEMVGAAKQFMTNPRVRNTPLEEQTDRLGAQMPSTSSSPLLSFPPASRTSTGQSIVDLARSALVFGTAGYMVYRFVRSWMLPHLLNVPDPAEERMQRLEEQVVVPVECLSSPVKVGRLSESSRCIAESVTQTLAAVTEQNEQLTGVSDFDRLNAEIGIVKSLLLNQNQFPPVPETAFPRNRRAVQNGQNSNNTKGKIAVSSLAKEENGEEAEEDGEGQRRNREMLSASNGSPAFSLLRQQ
uniref:Peroxin-14 n=1 Tax=Globodera pallida TaxID=36090 RepID=A0A183C7C2_GLOPA